jgi:hypothetical protein
MKRSQLINALLTIWAGICVAHVLAQSPAPTAAPAGKPPDITLPISTMSGAVYPSMRPAEQIRVFLNADTVADEVSGQEAKGWDCTKPGSYLVTSQGSKKQIPVEAVLPIGRGSCKDTTPDPVLLQISVAVDTNTAYEVSLAGLPDGKVVRSAATKFSSATKASFSATPQAVPGEAMNNGATRDVGQMNISYSMPFIGRSPALFNTKDVFSTDSEDAKSSWAVTTGVSFGLSPSWYTPVQLTETVQGNQAASNVSAVTNLSVSGLVPWYWSRKALNNPTIDAGLAPEFSLAGAYTRRIEQLVTAKTPKLSENDASINPSLTIEPFYMLPGLCVKYQAWLNKPGGSGKTAAANGKTPAAGSQENANGEAQAGSQGNGSGGTSRQFCVGLQPDLGLYYLPLDETKAGSEKIEGYGDISILIPLSNLSFSDFQLIKADGLLNSQIHIKWSDSVNAANNYARTRQWTFGIEVMK